MIKTVPYSTVSPLYKWFKRLVYTHPDLLARFCKVHLSNAKIWPDFPSKVLFVAKKKRRPRPFGHRAPKL